MLEKYPPEKYNRLLPTITLADVTGQLIKPVIEIVTISSSLAEEGPKEVYQDSRMKKELRAISRRGLQKINAAGGLDFPPAISKVEKFVPGKYIIYQAGGVIRAADGTPRVQTAIRIIDLELEELKLEAEGARGIWKTVKGQRQKVVPTEEELEQYVKRAILNVRENMPQNAETKAQNRVTRKVFALKDAYTIAELEKPFVVFRYDSAYDLTDPDQLRALLAQANESSGRVYGVGITASTPASTPGPSAGRPPGEEVGQAEVAPKAEPHAAQEATTTTGAEPEGTAQAYQLEIRDRLIDRIRTISNVFELNNWSKKHQAEVDALPGALRMAVKKALVAQSNDLQPPAVDPPEGVPEAVVDLDAPLSFESEAVKAKAQPYAVQLEQLKGTDYPIVKARFLQAIQPLEPEARLDAANRFRSVHSVNESARPGLWAKLILELEGVKL
jgi:hypothetical protein